MFTSKVVNCTRPGFAEYSRTFFSELKTATCQNQFSKASEPFQIREEPFIIHSQFRFSIQRN